MSKYQRGKIYKLCSKQTDKVYIGSTTRKLKIRLQEHKSKFKIWKREKKGYHSSFEILKYGDFYIELIEDFPYETKIELLQKEASYIRQLNCVNREVPGRHYSQWKKEHKSHIKQRSKLYYERTRERDRNKRKVWGKLYRERNRDKIKARKKLYREQNRDKIKARVKQPYACVCGVTCRQDSKYKHFKSKKHRLYIHNLHNIFNHM